MRLLPVLILLTACGGSPGTAELTKSAPDALTSSELSALGIANLAQPRPGLITAGQLSESQFEQLAAQGALMINLRSSSENGTGWEEDFAATRGFDFQRLPISGPAGLTRANSEALSNLLAGADDRDVVLYCASGNRVGALLALEAYEHAGVAAQQALELGLAAGLRSLEPQVRAALELAPGSPR